MLIEHKKLKKELERDGHKVPHYLLNLPPTPPDAEILFGGAEDDDNLVRDILESKGKRLPGKRREKKKKTAKDNAHRAKLNLPRHIEERQHRHLPE